MHVIQSFFRRSALAAITCATLAAATALPGVADIRQQMADKAATQAGNSFVAKIQGESCSDFAATMQQMKGKSATSSPSPLSEKLKSNTEARTTFVNIVAAPLLNKMIDCGMMPGGM